MDNVSEFAEYEWISKRSRMLVFFTDSFSPPSKRGTWRTPTSSSGRTYPKNRHKHAYGQENSPDTSQDKQQANGETQL